MANFALLGICMLAGILLRRFRRLPADTPVVLNGFIFYISFPALVLSQFQKIHLDSQAFGSASLIWALFILSVGFFFIIGSKWDRKTLGSAILTAGLGNTSFVGFPMLEALYGPGVLKTAVLVDQLGSFLVLSTLGIGTASFFSTRTVSVRQVGRRILAFPPVYALLLAFALRFTVLPNFLIELLNKLASTLTPLALVSTGFQLRMSFSILRKYSSQLTLGLFYKLFLGPLLLAGVCIGLFHWKGEVIRIAILEAAMAPMITASVVAAEYQLNSEFANLMVGVGIPISFLTIPLWAAILP